MKKKLSSNTCQRNDFILWFPYTEPGGWVPLRKNSPSKPSNNSKGWGTDIRRFFLSVGECRLGTFWGPFNRETAFPCVVVPAISPASSHTTLPPCHWQASHSGFPFFPKLVACSIPGLSMVCSCCPLCWECPFPSCLPLHLAKFYPSSKVSTSQTRLTACVLLLLLLLSHFSRVRLCATP